jgi:hypothetical protein
MLNAFAMFIPSTPPNQGEYLKLPKYYAPLPIASLDLHPQIGGGINEQRMHHQIKGKGSSHQPIKNLAYYYWPNASRRLAKVNNLVTPKALVIFLGIHPTST